jgi:hypothetical protein
MGMDVCGRHPRTEDGKIFDLNWASWEPLVTYMEHVAPEIVHRCTYWRSNDGDGLNEEDAIALADVLQAELDAGRTEGYFARRYGDARSRSVLLTHRPRFDDEAMRQQKMQQLKAECPDLDDDFLRTVGVENVQVVFDEEDDLLRTIGAENVRSFVAFLRECGGFSLW